MRHLLGPVRRRTGLVVPHVTNRSPRTGDSHRRRHDLGKHSTPAPDRLSSSEADTLFGKRSEVKDSHDRYANIEVSYLLQRMEAYRGLAILTTNRKSALDDAFMRRLRFVVQFPFPDRAQWAAIWQRIYPAETPTEGLDWSRVASSIWPGATSATSPFTRRSWPPRRTGLWAWSTSWRRPGWSTPSLQGR
jgi:hypothetical protein